MAEFDDNHSRVLVNTFHHVDQRLTELEQKLEAASLRSPFHEYTTDLSPAQRKMIMSHIAVIQESMLQFLRDQGIPPRRNRTSIRRVAQTTLQFLHIAFEELRPKYLRGYGAVADEAARELNKFVTRIQALLDQMNHELGAK